MEKSAEKVRFGMIGLGARAETLFAAMDAMPDVELVAICDVNPAKIERFREIFSQKGKPLPTAYTDHRELLKNPSVQGVFAPTSWNAHLQIAEDAMLAGKYIGIEVGGASSLDELWHLVHAAEATGVSCMMLENCCYGRNELMVLNMVRQGLFGELIYCECGYEHCLQEMAEPDPKGRRAERILHNKARCADLYPTHGLGPISKILNINRGNRFLTISSHATKARGFDAYYAQKAGTPPPVPFREGDVVTSVIHCANGENITLTHGVSLPRPYSRDCRVQGTKGIWLENANGVYIDGISPCHEKTDIAGNPYWEHEWTPIDDRLYAKYDHPIWQSYRENIIGGHGGMDALVIEAFADAIRRNAPTPIDVYDCAAWMAVTCLSEESIALGGMPVAFPDFTNGKWLCREKEPASPWMLSDVFRPENGEPSRP